MQATDLGMLPSAGHEGRGQAPVPRAPAGRRVDPALGVPIEVPNKTKIPVVGVSLLLDDGGVDNLRDGRPQVRKRQGEGAVLFPTSVDSVRQNRQSVDGLWASSKSIRRTAFCAGSFSNS